MIRSTPRPCAQALTTIVLLLSLAVPAQAATWLDVMIAYENAVRAIAEMPNCVIWIKRDDSPLATQYSIVQRCGTGGFDSVFSTQITEHFPNAKQAGWCETISQCGGLIESSSPLHGMPVVTLEMVFSRATWDRKSLGAASSVSSTGGPSPRRSRPSTAWGSSTRGPRRPGDSAGTPSPPA